MPPYSTGIYAATDITQTYGYFATGAYPGVVAFSPDDTFVYQSEDSSQSIKIFSTENFRRFYTITLPHLTEAILR